MIARDAPTPSELAAILREHVVDTATAAEIIGLASTTTSAVVSCPLADSGLRTSMPVRTWNASETGRRRGIVSEG